MAKSLQARPRVRKTKKVIAKKGRRARKPVRAIHAVRSRSKKIIKSSAAPRPASVVSRPLISLEPPPRLTAHLHPNQAYYFYGVSAESDAALLPVDSLGVDGISKVEAIHSAGFVAWISRVAKREFADLLPHKMDDLDWLSAASVRHQRAVSAIARTIEIVPARFGVVMLGERMLCDELRKHRVDLERDLKRVAGAGEWGIKVFHIPQPRSIVDATSGKERRRLEAERLHEKRDPEVGRFAAELNKLAADTTEGRKVRMSNTRPNLEWQASLLVRSNRTTKLREVIERYSQKWEGKKRIECTGPWPPYSFVSRN